MFFLAQKFILHNFEGSVSLLPESAGKHEPYSLPDRTQYIQTGISIVRKMKLNLKKQTLKAQISSKEVAGFFASEIWKIKTHDLPPIKRTLLKAVRILMIAIKSFDNDRVQLRASALTYYSLLSIVPVLAMAFGISKGFGLDELLEQQLQTFFEGNQTILAQSLDFAQKMLQNTKGGIVAGVGFVLLVWSVMKLLISIEASFNDVWSVKRPRSYVRKFTDYTTIMVIAPILLIVSSSVTIFITGFLKNLAHDIRFLSYFSSYIIFLINLIPYSLIWILLTLLYMIIPNTKVKIQSAFISAVVTGSSFQLLQWIYITFQIGVTRSNAIYGSFAALPLFLVFVQLSWIVILLGAKLCYAHQNIQKFEFGNEQFEMSIHHRKVLALSITNLLLKGFAKAEPPLTVSQISDKLKTPLRFVTQATDELVAANVIVPALLGDARQPGFVPAQDPRNLTFRYIIEAIEKQGFDDIQIADLPEVASIIESLKSMEESAYSNPNNQLLGDVKA